MLVASTHTLTLQIKKMIKASLIGVSKLIHNKLKRGKIILKTMKLNGINKTIHLSITILLGLKKN